MAEDNPAEPAAKSQQSIHRQHSQSAEFHDSVFTNLGDPLSLVYKNLTYTVKIKEAEPVDEEKEEARKWYQFAKRPKKKKVEKVILDDLTGIFRPGRLTAIMGASGAGKTSLLSVLAGQVNATYVNGTILINDDDFSESGQMQEISGFVFQDDVLLPSMKVKEAIKMSALLRLPETVTKEERLRRVEEIIQILHLKKAAKTEVGNPLKKGISGGERKRTSIAMEIITNPAMLFLDEPTSGLDTFTAYTVCKALQNLAHRQGRTIVATIHQPSSDIFYLFDDLLILAEGRIAYYGPTEGCIEYFSDLGYPCPQYSNPADYIFMNILSDIDGKTATTPIGSARSPSTISRARRRETRPVSWIPSGITESSEQRIQRVLEYWPNSPECERMTEMLENVPVKGVGTLSYKGRASYWTQFMFLMGRASKNAIRNPMIVRVRLFQSIFIGLLLGLIYMDQSQYPIGQQIQNRAGVLFFIAVNQYFAAANQILAVFYEEKTVFFREFQAGYYRLSAYYWTKIIVELPYQFLFPYLLIIIAYYMIGLNPAFSSYLLCGLIASLVGMTGTATGIFIASIFSEITTALAVLPVVLLPLLLFSGFFANSNTLPVYLSWIQYISPIKYGFVALCENEFQGQNFKNCPPNEDCSGERALKQLGFENGLSVLVNIIFILVIYFVLIIGAFLILWFKLRKKNPHRRVKKDKKKKKEEEKKN